MAEIKQALKDFNPWWEKEFSLEYKEREIYFQIQKFLQLPQIIAFTGLRRVGKTTIMHKIVKEFIEKGLEPKKAIYFSFDEFKETRIRDILKEYEAMMETNLRDGKYLLLLDEVQILKDWESQLKAVYDTFGKNIKIIISGSESLFIKRKAKSTLAGRLFEFKIEPLSFKEFLAFKGADLKPISLYEQQLAKLFNEFILTLGFPELVGIKDKLIIKKYVKESIIEKIIYRDIPKLFKIDDITILESLLNIFMDDPGQIIELSSLANELNISRQTLSNYLMYLEESFLIRKLYNFSRNRRKVERKLKKYYPSIISVDLLFKDDEFSKSRVFEYMLINQLQAEFFWRDPYKNEVDAVLMNENPTPVEIKYGKTGIQGLLAFMNKFKVAEGYIISSEKEGKQTAGRKSIFIVPAYKFLLKQKPR